MKYAVTLCIFRIIDFFELIFSKQLILKDWSNNTSVCYLTHEQLIYVIPSENSFLLLSTAALSNINPCDWRMGTVYERDTRSPIRFALEHWPLITQPTDQIKKIGPCRYLSLTKIYVCANLHCSRLSHCLSEILIFHSFNLILFKC